MDDLGFTAWDWFFYAISDMIRPRGPSLWDQIWERFNRKWRRARKTALPALA